MTVILAVATIATASSGYQAARWGGVQSKSFSHAGAMRTESVRASNEAHSLKNLDVWLFGQWVNATLLEEQEVATFYERRFREEFRPAFDDWMASDPYNNPDAALSPFDLPSYSLASEEMSQQHASEAEESFNQGTEANQHSIAYVLNTVILATVLFLGGIVNRFTWPPARITITALAAFMLVVGLFNLMRFLTA